MRIVVLFNLRNGVDEAAYQAWAKATDIPVVNGLASIASFTVHQVTGLLGSDAKSPYQYIEVIDVADMDQFGKDVATETMKRVSAEFQAFADNPIFLTTQDLV
jgi:5,10-methylenetetrahydrofolate reductase